MSHSFDPRKDPAVLEILRSIRSLAHLPFTNRADLREAKLVLDALPALKFPINSAGEFLDQVEQSGQSLELVGVKLDTAALVHRLPAHYFPIASLENLTEKIAELVRANRKKVDVTAELSKIKSQLPTMHYPINNARELVKQLGPTKRYKYQGDEVEPQQIAQSIPLDIFPITSQDDFDRKICDLMVNRPLIVGHRKRR